MLYESSSQLRHAIFLLVLNIHLKLLDIEGLSKTLLWAVKMPMQIDLHLIHCSDTRHLLAILHPKQYDRVSSVLVRDACPECRILSVNIVHLINYLFS